MSDPAILILTGWVLFAVIVILAAWGRAWLERDTKAIEDAQKIDRNWP